MLGNYINICTHSHDIFLSKTRRNNANKVQVAFPTGCSLLSQGRWGLQMAATKPPTHLSKPPKGQQAMGLCLGFSIFAKSMR